MGLTKHMKKNSKVFAVDGGAIGILEDEAALLKWAVGGSIVSHLLNQADQDISNPHKSPKHHEDTDLHQKNFRKDLNSILGALMEYGNPFWEEESMLV